MSSGYRCPKDGVMLEGVEVVSSVSSTSLVCPRCGSRYLPVVVGEGDEVVVWQTWDESWSDSWGGRREVLSTCRRCGR